ncbi:MAG: hypothetical protein WD512_19330, partial [Candidatus Paceibacterota bacterium]
DYHYLKDGKEQIHHLQKTNRVFISNKGGHLYKKKDNRVNGVYVGNKVTVFNRYIEANNYNINYHWYINETNKIIDILEPKQLTLF